MDTRIAFGTEIKTLSDDGETMRIGAHLVLFGSPEEHDLYPNRDYFTKNTDFGLVEGKGVAPVLYHHGLNPVLGNRKLATAALSLDDDGVWMETELKARDAYESRVMQLVRAGKLGTSSGAWKKDIERVAVVNKNGDTCHEIKKWHLGMDASLTPTPADPRTLAMEMKSLEEVEGWADELGEEDAEFKGARGWQTQPRDDGGKWTDGAGNLSASHVHDVMRAEGITKDHHFNEVRDAIKSGRHKTREDVLKHIDHIHARIERSNAKEEATLNYLTGGQRAAETAAPEVEKTEPSKENGRARVDFILPNGQKAEGDKVRIAGFEDHSFAVINEGKWHSVHETTTGSRISHVFEGTKSPEVTRKEAISTAKQTLSNVGKEKFETQLEKFAANRPKTKAANATAKPSFASMKELRGAEKDLKQKRVELRDKSGATTAEHQALNDAAIHLYNERNRLEMGKNVIPGSRDRKSISESDLDLIETESPETQAPELKSFADHRDEALDAIDGFITRAGEIKALRESRKSGAPVSAAMRDNLNAAAERLMELKATIESILTEADVEAKSDTTETDAAPATAPDDAPADAEAVNAAWDAFIAHHVKAAGI